MTSENMIPDHDVNVNLARDAALKLAAQGWPVFPLHSIRNDRCTCYGRRPDCKPGKHPRWHRVDLPNGVLNATTNANQIRTWWERWPDANLGVALPANLIVVDVDPRNGGAETWAALIAQHGPLPATVEAATGGGGTHYVLALPDGVDPSGLRGTLGQGVDVKKLGGYIVVAPSVTTGPYAWVRSPEDMEPATAPEWVIGLLRAGGENGRRSEPVPERITEGGRNTTLTSIAGSMRRPGMTEEEIADALFSVNARRCDPPLPEDEVRAIASSVGQYPPASRQNTQQPPRTIRAIPVSELEDRPTPPYLIKGLLSRGTTGSATAQSGVGKTLLALDMACHVALGRAWRGRKVTQGSVAFVVGEGGSGFGQRVKAWRQYHGYDGPLPLYVVEEPVNFREQADPDAVIAALLELPEPPVMVVIDTLAWVMAGGDENTVRDMMPVMTAVRKIAEATGATVLIVHHTTKDGETYRGSSALRGALDTMLSLAKSDGLITLTVDKQRDMPFADPLHFALRAVTLGTDEDGDPILAPVLVSTDEEPPMRINASERKALTVLSASSTGLGTADWQRATEMTRATFYRVLGTLTAKQLVAKPGDRYILTETGRTAIDAEPPQVVTIERSEDGDVVITVLEPFWGRAWLDLQRRRRAG